MKPLEHLYRVAPGKARGRARCPPTSPTLRWPTSVLNSRPMLSDVHSRIRHGYITKMRNQAVIFNITMSLSRERANPFERRHAFPANSARTLRVPSALHRPIPFDSRVPQASTDNPDGTHLHGHPQLAADPASVDACTVSPLHLPVDPSTPTTHLYSILIIIAAVPGHKAPHALDFACLLMPQVVFRGR